MQDASNCSACGCHKLIHHNVVEDIYSGQVMHSNHYFVCGCERFQ